MGNPKVNLNHVFLYICCVQSEKVKSLFHMSLWHFYLWTLCSYETNIIICNRDWRGKKGLRMAMLVSLRISFLVFWPSCSSNAVIQSKIFIQQPARFFHKIYGIYWSCEIYFLWFFVILKTICQISMKSVLRTHDQGMMNISGNPLPFIWRTIRLKFPLVHKIYQNLMGRLPLNFVSTFILQRK